jgi:hypothetical protein
MEAITELSKAEIIRRLISRCEQRYCTKSLPELNYLLGNCMVKKAKNGRLAPDLSALTAAALFNDNYSGKKSFEERIFNNLYIFDDEQNQELIKCLTKPDGDFALSKESLLNLLLELVKLRVGISDEAEQALTQAISQESNQSTPKQYKQHSCIILLLYCDLSRFGYMQQSTPEYISIITEVITGLLDTNKISLSVSNIKECVRDAIRDNKKRLLSIDCESYYVQYYVGGIGTSSKIKNNKLVSDRFGSVSNKIWVIQRNHKPQDMLKITRIKWYLSEEGKELKLSAPCGEISVTDLCKE